MSSTRPGPRERLLDAARDLTYRQGVHVGVDAILKQADVARRSLYQHFGGKDGLIAEVLRTSAQEDRYRTVMDAAGEDPRARVLAVFDELERITTAPGFRGCRYTSADLALTDPRHPAHTEVRRYKDGVHALFTDELTRLGHPSPEAAADQLLVLVDGVLAHAVTRPDAHPARAARRLAEHVLDARD
ncbi:MULTISPECIES: TetR/AcrR family transcriptional regulator [Streptomyces]|uniref:TetR family transcriptional regulator n=2 Tax=Streptomyces TaxID=1883 RepID=A0A2U9PC12_STRAS|nr:TetR/AcrR family transcriptional regulator [Streptomyces actuosus]AWT47083.1 TetR family transcriptional regulator [Streptomyces actuosus]MBM4823732.1 TetR/AcrR family transcriptional regulator [Streptomyces actuosus]